MQVPRDGQPALGFRIARVKQDADLTKLLQSWSHGEPEALERLAPLVQGRLREIARRPDPCIAI